MIASERLRALRSEGFCATSVSIGRLIAIKRSNVLNDTGRGGDRMMGIVEVVACHA